MSCSSSSQMASSFGERKYMKGHFSDPIATIKAKFAPDNTIAGPAVIHNKQKVEIPNSIASPYSIINAKALSPIVTKTIGLGKKQVMVNSTVGVSSAISFKGNASVKANSDESISEYHHDSDSGSEHHYLKFFLIFLLISIIFLILLLLVFGGSGAGVLSLLISVACFIIALVFLFLWLISLAG